jgi:ribosome-associated protein
LPKTRSSTKNGHIRRQLQQAIRACLDKKGEDLSVLKLGAASGAFTDYFVLCTGSNPRQIQAISDEIESRLSQDGMRPAHTEGYNQAEWVLLDYVDFVVHVFSPKARSFYDLERLWKSASKLNPGNLKALHAPAKRKPAARGARARTAARSRAAAGRTTRTTRRKG